jgi:Bacterial regulatory proteins, luxR family
VPYLACPPRTVRCILQQHEDLSWIHPSLIRPSTVGVRPVARPGEKDREILPFVGSPYSQWDARNGGDRTGQAGKRGGPILAAREREVLAIMGQGFSNKRIARALQISPETSEIACQAYLLEADRQHAPRPSFELHRFGSCDIQNRCLLTHASAEQHEPPPSAVTSSSAFDAHPVRGWQATREVPQ